MGKPIVVLLVVGSLLAGCHDDLGGGGDDFPDAAVDAAAPDQPGSDADAGALPPDAGPDAANQAALAAKRAACAFTTGARVTETLGISEADRAALPITHIIIMM